jgi:hypothetical protein
MTSTHVCLVVAEWQVQNKINATEPVQFPWMTAWDESLVNIATENVLSTAQSHCMGLIPAKAADILV